MKTINLKLAIVIATILISLSITQLNSGYGQNKKTTGIENESNKYTNYLQNARNLLNQTSNEYKNKNYTGAEELAISAYLDNFEYVERVLEQKTSHVFMTDIEHKMREEIRDLIKDKANQTQLDNIINATDAKLNQAINLLKGEK